MRAWGRKNRGAAVIEFAILLPLLLLIVFGLIEFGFNFLQYHYIANAAREGARIAAKLPEVDDVKPDVPDMGLPYVQIGVRDYLRGVYRNLTDDEIEFHCCGFDPSVTPTKFVTIVVEAAKGEGATPMTLATFGAPSGLDPEPEAVRVRVTVNTEQVWTSIFWKVPTAEPAVFVRE